MVSEEPSDVTSIQSRSPDGWSWGSRTLPRGFLVFYPIQVPVKKKTCLFVELKGNLFLTFEYSHVQIHCCKSNLQKEKRSNKKVLLSVVCPVRWGGGAAGGGLAGMKGEWGTPVMVLGGGGTLYWSWLVALPLSWSCPGGTPVLGPDWGAPYPLGQDQRQD